VPAVNWIMLIAVIVLVFQFKSSGALAAAYGIAVSGTMIFTSLLTLIVINAQRGKYRTAGLIVMPVFLLLEMIFFGSNLTKLMDGGWMPMVLGLFIFTLLITWKRGSKAVAAARRQIDIKMEDFLSNSFSSVQRVPGTAIYMTSDPSLVPSALFHNLKHFKVMHAQTVFLHVVTEDVPRIAQSQRLAVQQLDDSVFTVTVRFGFREEPNVMNALAGLPAFNVQVDPMQVTFFVARTTIVSGPGVLPHWQAMLFGWMNRQSDSVAGYFNLPANCVVELGTQVSL
jgi:KUP system potassium uptake protein